MTASFVFYSGLVFLTALIGGLFPLVVPQTHVNRLKILVALGAGILLGMSLVHMVPEASHLIPHTFGLWILTGFLILLVLERFIMVHACEEHGCDYHTVGVAAFAGLTIHGIIEGMALASSFLVSSIGPLVLLGILAHKAPAGVALTSILRLAGKSKKQIVLFVLGVSVSVPLGAYLAYALIQKDSLSQSAGVLLAMSAGTFLYISACDLLPELHRGDGEKFRRLGAFLFGILLSYLSGLLIGPHHHH